MKRSSRIGAPAGVGAAILAVVVGCGGGTPKVGTPPASSTPSSHTTTAHTSDKGMPMAMPMMPLGTATWQGMKIEAIRMAPVTFGIFTGTQMRVVKKTKKDSFHLMIKLTDARTKAPIPYASVWATIRKGKKIVFDERQWPMLSAFMGVHYGNNVALPGPGLYTLSVLIGPPQVARHPEYMHVWLKPHRVTFAFHWKGASS